MWVLGTESGSSRRARSAINHWAIFPAPKLKFLLVCSKVLKNSQEFSSCSLDWLFLSVLSVGSHVSQAVLQGHMLHTRTLSLRGKHSTCWTTPQRSSPDKHFPLEHINKPLPFSKSSACLFISPRSTVTFRPFCVTVCSGRPSLSAPQHTCITRGEGWRSVESGEGRKSAGVNATRSCRCQEWENNNPKYSFGMCGSLLERDRTRGLETSSHHPRQVTETKIPFSPKLAIATWTSLSQRKT